jgi:hypothetical protein
MVQATVWNKTLASTVSEHHPKVISLEEVKRNSAGPPNDDMGSRILDAYLSRTHPRYPFLDRSDIMERHANRFSHDNTSVQDQFGTFKIYMINAIGATLLKLTEPYDYSPGEFLHDGFAVYLGCERVSFCTKYPSNDPPGSV